ncbi:MAG: 16S rRNA (guanine(966)-N(2))-methyltransferase RsmD [Candidatus Saccharibacteria bacterium]
MRVIAGTAKGRKLKVPIGPDIRPVTDMIKGAYFNTIGQYLNGLSFLDLFAGSGSMGIEAVSRGAREAVFVELDPKAVSIIKENLRNCGFEKNTRVIKGDVIKVASQLQREGSCYDFIYADPPFRLAAQYNRLAEDLAELVTENGLVVLRMPKGTPAADNLEGAGLTRTSIYGDSVLYFYNHI